MNVLAADALRTTRTATEPAARGIAPFPRLAFAVLGIGMLGVAMVVAYFNTRIGGFILDETMIKQSAVSYTANLPHSLLHDVNARGTSRLYPLLISQLFSHLDGDSAVRAARALNAPLFVAAAVPVTLLAREVVSRWWLAVGAGLAAITVPWLTLTTAMFSESLSYVAVATAVWAMYWAFLRPAWWRDGLVVLALAVAVGGRTQLLGLGLGYVLIIALRAWMDRSRDGGWRASVRRLLLAYPFTAAIAALAVALVVRGAVANTLRSDLAGVLGTYARTTSDATAVPSNVGATLGVEGVALALGVGIIPALLSLVWYPRAVAGRLGGRARALAAVVLIAIGALVAGTAYAQGGSWGPITEERYYIYAAPFLWIGAVAAADRRWASESKEIAMVGGLLAGVAVLVALPRVLDLESSYFAPAMAVTNYAVAKVTQAFADVTGLGGPGAQDLVAIGVAVIVLVTWLLWRRMSRSGPLVALGIGLALQLIVTGIAFAAIAGKITGVPGRVVYAKEFKELGFVDRAVDGAPVTWVANQIDAVAGQKDLAQRAALLYNTAIRSRLVVPASVATSDNFPLNSLPAVFAEPAGGGADGSAPLAGPVPFVVQAIDSPFVQIAGERAAIAPRSERLELLRVGGPPRAIWLSTGLDVGGVAAPGSAVHFTAWSPGPTRLTVQALDRAAAVRLSLGTAKSQVRLRAGQITQITLRSCGGRVRGGLATTAPVRLSSVRLDRAACPRSP